MNGGKEEGVVAGIGIQPNGELAQMARLVYRLRHSELVAKHFCKNMI